MSRWYLFIGAPGVVLCIIFFSFSGFFLHFPERKNPCHFIYQRTHIFSSTLSTVCKRVRCCFFLCYGHANDNKLCFISNKYIFRVLLIHLQIGIIFLVNFFRKKYANCDGVWQTLTSHLFDNPWRFYRINELVNNLILLKVKVMRCDTRIAFFYFLNKYTVSGFCGHVPLSFKTFLRQMRLLGTN